MKRYCQTLELVGDSQMIESFDFVVDNARLATLPRQAEWEAYVARFQGCDPSMTSTQKWHLMEKIFQLDPSATTSEGQRPAEG